MNGFQYRVPGNHGKEQYHLALNDLHKKYGSLVREVIVQLSRLLYSPIFCGKRKAVYYGALQKHLAGFSAKGISAPLGRNSAT